MRLQLFALALGIAVFNGIFSPLVFVVAVYSFVWAPPWLPAGASLTFYLSSLIVATSTLLLSGVPAAVIERLRPQAREAPGPALVWAIVALILSLPAIIRLLLITGAAA